MFFRQIEDPYLAQFAYLIGCQATGEALLIDPERDVDRYVEIAESNKLRIVAVAETHIHADFVSGAREFAKRNPVTLYLSKEGGSDWQYEWRPESHSKIRFIKHGDTFNIGKIEIEAVHTPGHTPEHLCYFVTDRGGGADSAMGLVSGDFVFVGDVGRPDLLETAAGQAGAKTASAKELYLSLLDFMTLPDHLKVWPGHGAGSACGKALGAIPDSTVGYERRYNPALLAAVSGEERFMREILHGQPEPPLYFAQMKRWNKIGPPLLPENFVLPRVAPDTLPRLAERDDTVVIDTRDRSQFFARHIKGSLWIPLTRSFPTYAGSLIRPDQNVIVISAEQAAPTAVRLLWRIGHDNISGCVPLSDFEAWSGHEALSSIPIYTFAEAVESDDVILDVRGETEFFDGHLPNALNIPHTRILTRLNELPSDRRILVHCSTGSRSASVASLLDKLGFTVSAIDQPIEEAAQFLVQDSVNA